MKSKKFLLVVLLNSLVFTSISSFGTTSTTTQSVVASKDAHVYDEYPNNNYGSWTDMYCGIMESPMGATNLAYIHFYLSSISPGWNNVKLKLTVNSVSKVFPMRIGIVNEYWVESIITWNNRPSDITWHIQILDFTTDGTYYFDFSNNITSTMTDFCIIFYCLYMGENLLIASREHSNSDFHPQLIFSYNVDDDINDSGGIAGIVVGIVLVSVFSVTGTLLYREWKRDNFERLKKNLKETKIKSSEKFEQIRKSLKKTSN